MLIKKKTTSTTENTQRGGNVEKLITSRLTADPKKLIDSIMNEYASQCLYLYAKRIVVKMGVLVNLKSTGSYCKNE